MIAQESKLPNTIKSIPDASQEVTNFQKFTELAILLQSKGVEVPDSLQRSLNQLNQIDEEVCNFSGFTSPNKLVDELEARFPLTEKPVLETDRLSVFEESENASIEAYETDIKYLENRFEKQSQHVFAKQKENEQELISAKANLSQWYESNFSHISSFNEEHQKRENYENKLKESDEEIQKKRKNLIEIEASIKEKKNKAIQLKKQLHSMNEQLEHLRFQLNIPSSENLDVSQRYKNELKILNGMKHKKMLLNMLSPIKEFWTSGNGISFQYKNHEFSIQGLKCNDERLVTIKPPTPRLQTLLQHSLNNKEVESLYDISVTTKEILSAHNFNDACEI